MACHYENKFHQSCQNLANILKDHSSFILGFNKDETELTHAQTMKIRCGGLLGMQRIMNIEVNSPPVIPDIISVSHILYGDALQFPFNKIMQDIKKFSHRKKRH